MAKHTDPQREYVAALAQYRRAMRRIIEAKRHIPEFDRDRRRREARELRAWQREQAASPEVRRANEEGRRALMDWALAKISNEITAALIADGHIPGSLH